MLSSYKLMRFICRTKDSASFSRFLYVNHITLCCGLLQDCNSSHIPFCHQHSGWQYLATIGSIFPTASTTNFQVLRVSGSALAHKRRLEMKRRASAFINMPMITGVSCLAAFRSYLSCLSFLWEPQKNSTPFLCLVICPCTK